MSGSSIVIIGGGQAGLALSRCLTDRNIDHLVLERGRVAERWRSERWDSFRLLSPNWHTRLPGHRYSGPDPDGFMDRDQIVALFESYARSFDAPVQASTEVRHLHRADDRWRVTTDRGDLIADQVVVATGPHDRPRIPQVGRALPSTLTQLHASRYRNPAQLPAGNVLVVGAGPSGQQIASELARDGRQVLLAVGRHRRLPRSYRGRDAFWWLDRTGASAVTVDQLRGADAKRRPGHVVLTGGRELCLQVLADEGVTLLGRLAGVDGWRIHLGADLPRDHLDAEVAAVRFMDAADEHAARCGLELPPAGPRPTLTVPPWATSTPGTIDLRSLKVTTVVWATGYRRDFRWIDADVFDPSGEPVHRRGVTAAPGLSFLGLSWLYRRGSASIDGVGHDARYLADVLARRVGARGVTTFAGMGVGLARCG